MECMPPHLTVMIRALRRCCIDRKCNLIEASRILSQIMRNMLFTLSDIAWMDSVQEASIEDLRQLRRRTRLRKEIAGW